MRCASTPTTTSGWRPQVRIYYYYYYYYLYYCYYSTPFGSGLAYTAGRVSAETVKCDVNIMRIVG